MEAGSFYQGSFFQESHRAQEVGGHAQRVSHTCLRNTWAWDTISHWLIHSSHSSTQYPFVQQLFCSKFCVRQLAYLDSRRGNKQPKNWKCQLLKDLRTWHILRASWRIFTDRIRSLSEAGCLACPSLQALFFYCYVILRKLNDTENDLLFTDALHFCSTLFHMIST